MAGTEGRERVVTDEELLRRRLEAETDLVERKASDEAKRYWFEAARTGATIVVMFTAVVALLNSMGIFD